LKNLDYIIVQAGGKGTRLGHLTVNKPKALVPVDNLPMLFHLFRKFPDKQFIVIADYRRHVLRAYLECFANVKYQVVDADGEGTCGGLRKACDLFPDGKPFMLVWSDLILPREFELPAGGNNYVGLSQTFPCRWKYEDGIFREEPSTEYGVAGLFVFADKSRLAGVPQSGELVRWMRDMTMPFTPLGLAGTREFGTLNEYNRLGTVKTRPFNKMTLTGDKVIKAPLDAQGKTLARRETAWYEFAKSHGVTAIPYIYGTNPLTMERIDGKNIYDCEPSDGTLGKIANTLKSLHNKKCIPADTFSVREAYYAKTMNRLDKIRNLVPFADDRTIIVNGRKCNNVFFRRREFERLLESVKCENFMFIHGDCTFSNIILRSDGSPALIDPRGYFGHTELFGDPNYDWAKLYYSIFGNYDKFNLKDFRLLINDSCVDLKIGSNGWENLAYDFFRLTETDERTIRLIHAVIWLSLTTYAWQDYDSICGAFYNGLYHLEELWK
jgi:GTP:adenosylcobinamide-phosphate guanylyltransferase